MQKNYKFFFLKENGNENDKKWRFNHGVELCALSDLMFGASVLIKKWILIKDDLVIFRRDWNGLCGKGNKSWGKNQFYWNISPFINF